MQQKKGYKLVEASDLEPFPCPEYNRRKRRERREGRKE